jgi:hypothetical protein
LEAVAIERMSGTALRGVVRADGSNSPLPELGEGQGVRARKSRKATPVSSSRSAALPTRPADCNQPRRIISRGGNTVQCLGSDLADLRQMPLHHNRLKRVDGRNSPLPELGEGQGVRASRGCFVRCGNWHRQGLIALTYNVIPAGYASSFTIVALTS